MSRNEDDCDLGCADGDGIVAGEEQRGAAGSSIGKRQRPGSPFHVTRSEAVGAGGARQAHGSGVGSWRTRDRLLARTSDEGIAAAAWMTTVSWRALGRLLRRAGSLPGSLDYFGIRTGLDAVGSTLLR